MEPRVLHGRVRPPASWSLLAGLVLAGCDYTPGHEPMRFSLNATTVEALEDEPATQAHVAGALDLLFGSPQAPGFLRDDDWEDDYDPNHPDVDADDGGSGEFTEAEREEMRADNLVRFAHEIGRIERGQDPLDRASKVPPSLQRDYLALAAEASSLTDAAFQAEAKALFADFYPSLADSAELYRQQCLHCHGVEGGGDGPTSGPKDRPFLDPRPRDYRKGIFKFTAVKDKARPRRADLYRVIDEGIYATAMPSFRRFSSAERHGLVDYVRLLAIRGEVENRLVATFQEEEVLAPKDVAEAYADVWEKWNEAKDKVVSFDGEIPAPTAALIARGDVLFHDAKKGNCASCHGDLGLGDGTSAWKIDETTGKKVSAYKDDWGYDILPRNLRQGLYRGGRRPIDIYRRIYAGINGGPMPGIGEAKDAEGQPVMGDEDMWALVHYVRSLAERDETVHGPENVQTAHAAPPAPSAPGGSDATGAAALGASAPTDAASASAAGAGH